jgi:glutamate formiminotransferase/formiminotetrahydrofolate cyclodeaminase
MAAINTAPTVVFLSIFWFICGRKVTTFCRLFIVFRRLFARYFFISINIYNKNTKIRSFFLDNYQFISVFLHLNFINQNKIMQLIECVPNFSEGRNADTIKQITDAIQSVEGIKLLDIDPGKDTNRTVVTFVGAPDAVVQAAFLGIKKASELIDMRTHSGEHARMGATDVCPLIPVSGITMDETVEYAHKLGKMVGEMLHIPVFMYESAATLPQRKNLATIRAGEYEGLPHKLQQPDWQPDYGAPTHNVQSGATVIGARDFLVAYNVNLNTTSVRRANSVAFDVREAGRVLRKNNAANGEILRDAQGEPLRQHGTLKSVKAVGWYIEEYKMAQVSMNLTDINTTPLHTAFDATEQAAQARGMRVTGSELVGLIPLKCLTDAGKHYLKKQQRSQGVSESELIYIAVKSLGLDALRPFDPAQKIIEYQLKNTQNQRLAAMNLVEFADETACESPAPGGGSVAAYLGTLGAALAAMVANLSAGKRGWEDKIQDFSDVAVACQNIKTKLITLVDEDTQAFGAIMTAFALPKTNEIEKTTRQAAVLEATKYAINIPLQTMQTAHSSLRHIAQMVAIGNPNSVTDAGVAALCARSAVYGAYLNVQVNATGCTDKTFAENAMQTAEQLLQETLQTEGEILKLVQEKLK